MRRSRIGTRLWLGERVSQNCLGSKNCCRLGKRQPALRLERKRCDRAGSMDWQLGRLTTPGLDIEGLMDTILGQMMCVLLFCVTLSARQTLLSSIHPTCFRLLTACDANFTCNFLGPRIILQHDLLLSELCCRGFSRRAWHMSV